jgi:hypothetical protein
MATIQGSAVFGAEGYDANWLLIGNADVGTPITVPRNVGSLTFGVAGTFGSATVVLQGSIDGVNYVGLKDANGVAISMTANAIVSMGNPPPFLRPSSSGGTATVLQANIHGTIFN